MSEWQHEIQQRLARLALRPERESEIVDELSQHLDEFVRERVASGMSEDAARRQALADLDVPGELARRLASTEVRHPLNLPAPGAPARGRWLSQVWQDVRLALRSVRRRPAFAAAVLATIALTIGPTTAIVSVGNWLLWTPSPAVADPGRLVVIWSGYWREGGSFSPSSISYTNLDDVRAGSRTLVGLSGWQESGVSVAAPGLTPKPVQGGVVTANFFDVVGVRLAAGRSFTSDEDRPPHGAAVIVISHGLAAQAFGGADAAVDKTLLVNGRPMTVVGVTPRAFGGATPTSQVDVWYPGGAYAYVNHLPSGFAERFAGRADGLFHTFIGRLAMSETGAAAQAELDTLLPALAERYPGDNDAFKEARARVFQGLGPQVLTRPRLANLVRGLLIVAGVLLVLGCANVANLLLSDGVRAQQERAVRLALGASRARLIRQVLTESVVLSLTGAAAGVALAIWLKQVIQVLLLPGLVDLPTPPVVPIDQLVLIVTLGAALICGILAGLAPAWLGTSTPLQTMLNRDGHRTGTRSPRVRTAFAAVQLALSLALVTGAALMVTTLRNFAQVDLGFAPDNVTTHYLNLAQHGYTADRAFVYNRSLLERLTANPDFARVSLSSGHPFSSGRIERLQTPGGTEQQTTNVYRFSTTESFSEVLGLQLLHGRYFTASEVFTPDPASGGPVVISESLARAFFGRSDAVGLRVTVPRTALGPTRKFQVIGVMRDARTRSLAGEPDLLLYRPMTLEDFQRPSTVLLTKARVPLARVNQVVERAAIDLDATLPVPPGRPIASSIARQLATVRVFAWVLSLLGGVGFLLASVGLYALLSQAVGERRREFGVRLAVGASNRHIASLVFRQAAWTSLMGTVAGLGLTLWGAGLVKSYLFGVSEFDPAVYAVSVAVLVAVVFIAASWPAWSATRVNPIETLRAE